LSIMVDTCCVVQPCRFVVLLPCSMQAYCDTTALCLYCAAHVVQASAVDVHAPTRHSRYCSVLCSTLCSSVASRVTTKTASQQHTANSIQPSPNHVQIHCAGSTGTGTAANSVCLQRTECYSMLAADSPCSKVLINPINLSVTSWHVSLLNSPMPVLAGCASPVGGLQAAC
jgi:hypothetical protein